jgi:hypothetical protein
MYLGNYPSMYIAKKKLILQDRGSIYENHSLFWYVWYMSSICDMCYLFFAICQIKLSWPQLINKQANMLKYLEIIKRY